MGCGEMTPHCGENEECGEMTPRLLNLVLHFSFDPYFQKQLFLQKYNAGFFPIAIGHEWPTGNSPHFCACSGDTRIQHKDWRHMLSHRAKQ
jgi:hypothetical protein